MKSRLKRDFFLMMEKSVIMTLIESISEIADACVARVNGFLVDVNIRGEKGSSVIEIYVDTDNGITADECAQVSRAIALELDQRSLIAGRYRLEVSSPGLDRPMKSVRQYRKNVGRRVSIIPAAPGENAPVEGTLQTVTEAAVTVKTKDKGERIFAVNDIREARVLPQFK